MRWLLLAAALLTACTSATPVTTTAPPTSESAPATATVGLVVPGALAAFPIAFVELAGESVPVAVADTRPRRIQGLGEVTDLGDLGGMLFVFESPVRSSFTMRDTLIPLDLHHLDADGTILEIISMEVCNGSECSYPASVDFSYSLETLPGAFDLSVGDTVGLPAP